MSLFGDLRTLIGVPGVATGERIRGAACRPIDRMTYENSLRPINVQRWRISHPGAALESRVNGHGLFNPSLLLLYFTTKIFGTGGGFMFGLMRQPGCGGWLYADCSKFTCARYVGSCISV